MADPATLTKLLHAGVLLFVASGVYSIARGGPAQAGSASSSSSSASSA